MNVTQYLQEVDKERDELRSRHDLMQHLDCPVFVREPDSYIIVPIEEWLADHSLPFGCYMEVTSITEYAERPYPGSDYVSRDYLEDDDEGHPETTEGVEVLRHQFALLLSPG